MILRRISVAQIISPINCATVRLLKHNSISVTNLSSTRNVEEERTFPLVSFVGKRKFGLWHSVERLIMSKQRIIA